MYYYEFTIEYSKGKVAFTYVEPQEVSDQIAYCKEGKASGYIKNYSYHRVEDTY